MTDADGTIPLDEAQRRANSEQPWRYPPTKLRPITWPEGPVPARRWVVPGLVPDLNVTLLGGDGGLGKSLLAQMLLTAAATGKMWLGKQTKSCKAVGYFAKTTKTNFAGAKRRSTLT